MQAKSRNKGTVSMVLWDGHKFDIGGVTFQSITSLDDLFTLKNEDGYIVGKTKSFIDKYVSVLADHKQCNVIELGVFRGGSAVFLNELMQPKRLAAVDIASDVPPMLSHYMQDSPRASAIKPFMGVDQASTPDLEHICQDFMGGEPIDVIVDDASHFYDETKASFQFLFPRLRPGGLYIIEDWGWANQSIDTKIFSPEYGHRKSMTNLIFEIVLAANTAPDLMPLVEVNNDFTVIHRGTATIKEPFVLGDHCFYRGQPLASTDFFETGTPSPPDQGES